MSPVFATRSYDSARRILAKGEKAGKSSGFGISLIAESMKGCLYTAGTVIAKDAPKGSGGGDRFKRQAPVVKDAKDKLQSKFLAQHSIKDLIGSNEGPAVATDDQTLAEQMGEEVACRLLAEIAEGGIADSSFQWMPLLYMGLADSYSPCRVILGRLTPHSLQLLRHLKDFFGLEYRIEPAGAEPDDADQGDCAPGSAEDDADIKDDVDGGDGECEDEEVEVAIEEERKQIEQMRLHKRLMISCVGVGL